jgi:hypothetical protein
VSAVLCKWNETAKIIFNSEEDDAEGFLLHFILINPLLYVYEKRVIFQIVSSLFHDKGFFQNKKKVEQGFMLICVCNLLDTCAENVAYAHRT